MEIVFATGNLHKVAEVNEMLPQGINVVPMCELGITEDIPETGETLMENSIIKAEYLYDRLHCNCFADDSGLEVDALGGAPGVYSARYAGDDALGHNFAANMDKLLSELSKLPAGTPRTARFKTVITLIVDGQKHFFEGVMEGRISYEKAGCGGFGYDPVFISDAYPDRTVAELPHGTKNQISHRGKAMAMMVQWLHDYEAGK